MTMQNVQDLAIGLYFAILPIGLLITADENFISGWNIFTDLSLLLPTVPFCCGWFWHSQTFYWDESTGDEVVV